MIPQPRPSPATDPARGLVSYLEAQEAQRRMVARRRAGEIPDLLWLLEHPPTITWGRASGGRHVLLSALELQERGISIYGSERGGDVTAHEPGQIVGYPIVHLAAAADRDLHLYLRRVEEGLISCLGELAIRAERIPGRTGVWVRGVPPRKIAAIGVRAGGWVTSHGFALNVENTLATFAHIIPCGISDGKVTSVAREAGSRTLPWGALVLRLHAAMEEALERRLELALGREGLRA